MRRLVALIRRLLRRLLAVVRSLRDERWPRLDWLEGADGRPDRPDYAGHFVANALDRLDALTRNFMSVSGHPVALEVKDVAVQSSASFQLIEVWLLAQRADEIPPLSHGVRLERRAEMMWHLSPDGAGTEDHVRAKLPQSFFYTFTSELSVDENLSALTDYISRRFELGPRSSR